MKICKSCDIQKNIEEFPKCKSGKDGYRIYCYDCCNKQKRESSLKIRKKYENNHIKVDYKICYVCDVKKSINSFYKNKSRKDGYCDECISCVKDRNKKNWYESVIKHRPIFKEGYKICSCCKKELQLCEFNNDPKGKFKKNSQCKKCYLEKSKIKKKTNLQYWLLSILRKRTNDAIKKCHKDTIYVKNHKSTDLLGCDLQTLKNHIENKFRDGMSWENRGKVWHIDHIIPCSYFNLTILEEQKKCFHYTNLQPLLVHENLKKSNKLNYIL